jgi:repressor LexA
MAQETLGQRLLTLRKAEGWSQEQVAKCLGISQQGYSLYETDSIDEMPLSKLVKLSTLFHVPFDELKNLALMETIQEPTHVG